MSSVTSGIITSAAQAGLQSRDVSAARTTERRAQETGGQRTGPGVTETGEVVTTSDNDTQVYADAEGTGSQGREDHEDQDGSAKEQGQDTMNGSQGVLQDQQGQWHVDVEA